MSTIKMLYNQIISIIFLLIFSVYGKEELIKEVLVADGLLYRHIALNQTQSIHTLEIDPQKIHISLQAIEGNNAQTCSAIAQKCDALAAINGGSFAFGSKFEFYIDKLLELIGYYHYRAFPEGTLKIHQWLSVSSKKMGFIGWNEKDAIPNFGVQTSKICLIINDQEFPVDHLNKPYNRGSVLFTSAYGQKMPRLATSRTCVHELIIQDGAIQDIKLFSRGLTAIPTRGLIYRVPGNLALDHPLRSCSIGERVQWYVKSNIEGEISQDYDYILGHIPLLIKNNEVTPVVELSPTAFYKDAHPRSAVALLPDGHWFFVIVDGRQKNNKGMSLKQLAEFLMQYKCIHALNLGGGGDTTLVIGGKVANMPSSGRYTLLKRGKERPLHNIFVLKTRNEANPKGEI